MTNQELSTIFEKYFEKSKNIETIESINIFEKENDLFISDEFKWILLNLGKVENFNIPFAIAFQNKEIFNFQFVEMFNLQDISQELNILRDREEECRQWYDYDNLGIDKFLPIGILMRDNPFYELFLCCNTENFGKVYLIDVALELDLIDRQPVKIEVANSLVDLILLSEQQQQKA